MSRALLSCLVLLPAMASAEPADDEQVSLAVAAHVAPLEAYPGVAMELGGWWHARPRLRLGGRFLLGMPGETGNARRHVTLAELGLRGAVLDRDAVRGVLGASVGLARFRDVFDRGYEDVTRITPGLSLSAAFEFEAHPHVWPYVEVSGSAYPTRRIADGQWASVGLGVRVPL